MRLGELSEAQGLALVDYLLAVERRRRGERLGPRSPVPSLALGAPVGNGCRRASGMMNSDDRLDRPRTRR